MVRDNSDDWRKLGEMLQRHRSTAFPRVQRQVELWEADVDLAEEDGYLTGLVETFLSRRRLDVASIQLDRSIDNRLQQAGRYTSGDALVSLLLYRAQLVEMARLLSATAQVPLTWRD